AGVVGNFSNLIQQFPLGNKANNMEIGITGYEIALNVYTRHTSPENWATLQNNLGNAYSDRIRGDKAENLENAVKAYTAALEVYTRHDFPVDWAMTQNNLATAYWDRIRGDKAENLENAIAAYKKALKVYTRHDFPVQWAGTQNNLGLAYGDRIRGDKAENLENAIAAYTAALEVRTRHDFPVDWAMTQNNLGTAYWDRIRGDKAENLENAIKAYTAALEVRTRHDFPQNNATTLSNLGILYQDSQQLNLAYSTFTQAIVTVENIRGEIISGEESKRKQAEEWNQLYRRMVEVCLGLGKETEAISYIERSKTRNLVELISGNVAFTPIQYSEIQNLLDDKTAIMQFYVFNDCFRAFIITQNNDKPIIWQSTEEDLKNLETWIGKYIENYVTTKDNWRLYLSQELTALANTLHWREIINQISPQYQKLIIIPHRYLHIVPFHAVPLSANQEYLQEYLFDRFPRGVSYAPSCQLLKFAKKPLSNSLLQGERTRLSNLFAIQNPNDDLQYTNIEVETIAQKFHPQTILKQQQATKENLLNQPFYNTFLNSQWLHFPCHGYFQFDQPLKSGLKLAGADISSDNANLRSSRYLKVDEQTTLDLDKCLTLEEIFDLNLTKCYLVCLSACETGLTDVLNTSDEYISLSSGFMKAGATNIISSLWAVSDFHTALLMIKFYENLETDVHNVVLSLNHAQKWLNQATQQQLVTWISHQHQMEEQAKQNILNILNTQYKPHQKPFRKPEYRAGFYAISPL
ncbi:MAG: CHAT domain-containing protein, partial [Cuspidothrix sp.]